MRVLVIVIVVVLIVIVVIVVVIPSKSKVNLLVLGLRLEFDNNTTLHNTTPTQPMFDITDNKVGLSCAKLCLA